MENLEKKFAIFFKIILFTENTVDKFDVEKEIKKGTLKISLDLKFDEISDENLIFVEKDFIELFFSVNSGINNNSGSLIKSTEKNHNTLFYGDSILEISPGNKFDGKTNKKSDFKFALLNNNKPEEINTNIN